MNPIDLLVLAERPRPTPSESASMIRDLGLGCGAVLAGLALVVGALGYLFSG